MSLLFLSFLAGILTVLAPCSFMLLPIIIGGSSANHNRYKPYIITASLALSLFIVTLILKVSSSFVNIDPVVISYISGIIIIFLGLISLFPDIWTKIQVRLGLSQASDGLLTKASEKEGVLGAILTGAALGPVFSSCSPTFVFLLTTVIREDFTTAILNMVAYIIGLSMIMLLVSLFGQRFTRKLGWAVNPDGIFKKIIAILFIIVGIAIITGFDKTIQRQFGQIPLVGDLEQGLLRNATGTQVNRSGGILFDDRKPAPEIEGISDWINSDGETLEDLKGKVVLIDFWTYSCINCLRASPYLNDWHDKYKDQGYTTIALHTPEFAFEKNIENVIRANDKDYKFEFPIGLDNDYTTWDNFENQFWPAKYLIDAEGNIAYTHFGEGKYDETEQAIRLLLEEAGEDVDLNAESTKIEQRGTFIPGQTQETYLFQRGRDFFANPEGLKGFATEDYVLVEDPSENFWSFGGRWEVTSENSVCKSDTCKLNIKFRSKNVYLVATPPANGGSSKVEVRLNGELIPNELAGSDVVDGIMEINEDKMYNVVSLQAYETNQLLTFTVPENTQLNVFTFGG